MKNHYLLALILTLCPFCLTPLHADTVEVNANQPRLEMKFTFNSEVNLSYFYMEGVYPSHLCEVPRITQSATVAGVEGDFYWEASGGVFYIYFFPSSPEVMHFSPGDVLLSMDVDPITFPIAPDLLNQFELTAGTDLSDENMNPVSQSTLQKTAIDLNYCDWIPDTAHTYVYQVNDIRKFIIGQANYNYRWKPETDRNHRDFKFHHRAIGRVLVELYKWPEMTFVDSVRSDTNGLFVIPVRESGTYITKSSSLQKGLYGGHPGLTANDFQAATNISKFPEYYSTVYTDMQFYAADVNQDGIVNNTDVLLIQSASVREITFFTNNQGERLPSWAYRSDTLEVDIESMHFDTLKIPGIMTGNCDGMMHGSYDYLENEFMQKSAPRARLLSSGDRVERDDQGRWMVPLSFRSSSSVKAFQFFVEYPQDLWEIDEVRLPAVDENSMLKYHIDKEYSTFNFSWFETETPLASGEHVFATLYLKPKTEINDLPTFALKEANSMVLDANAEKTEDWKVVLPQMGEASEIPNGVALEKKPAPSPKSRARQALTSLEINTALWNQTPLRDTTLLQEALQSDTLIDRHDYFLTSHSSALLPTGHSRCEVKGFVSYADFWDPENSNDRLLHRPIGQVLVELFDAQGTFIDSVRSQSDGHYIFPKGVDKGDYRLVASSPQKMLVREGTGITLEDANLLSDASFRASIQPNTILFLAADIDENNILAPKDASLIKGFIQNVALTNFPTIKTQGWKYLNDRFPIGLQNNEIRVRHLQGVMKGDINLSYTGEGVINELQRLQENSEIFELALDESNATFLFPNPAQEKIIFETYLSEDDHLQLKVIDMMGRILILKELGMQSVGQQRFEVFLNAVPPGVYLMVLDGDISSRMVRRFIVK